MARKIGSKTSKIEKRVVVTQTARGKSKRKNTPPASPGLVDKTIKLFNTYSTKQKMFVLVGIAVVGLALFLGYRFLVIAWVDRIPITRIQLDQDLEARYGKDATDRLIGQTLIMSEARKRNVYASDVDVKTELDKIAEEQGGLDKLTQLLQFQGMTIDDFQKQLKYQILIEKMFGKDITISEDEVKAYMETNKDQLPSITDEQSSESARLKQSISDTLKRQKTTQIFNDWLKQTTASSRVIRL